MTVASLNDSLGVDMSDRVGVRVRVGIAVVSATAAIVAVTGPTAHVARAVPPVCTSTTTSFTGNGTIGTSGYDYTVVTFRTPSEGADCSNSWTVPAGVTSIDVLVVGGGGSGGGDGGGGGGGGESRSGSATVTPAGTLTVTVGKGGAAASAAGNAGSASSLTGASQSFTANAGSGGATWTTSASTRAAGGTGGSGGTGTPGALGGYNPQDSNQCDANVATPPPPVGLYWAGTSSSRTAADAVGAGGTAATISGSSVTYSGGGGGGYFIRSSGEYLAANVAGASGGSGGGGAGAAFVSNNAAAGTTGSAGTGGGGGGGAACTFRQTSSNTSSGAGGSGVVVLRYTLTNAALTPAFGTVTSTSDGFTVAVTNYNAAFTWSASSTSGSASIDGSGNVTVTGLAASASTNVTVQTSRTGYAPGSASVTGAALGGGGGGGGGGSSSSTSSTESPSTTPAPTLDPIPANAGLAPGQDKVSVDGVAQPVSVTPNAAGTRVGVTGSGFTMSVGAQTATGQPLPLSPTGSVQVARGDQLWTAGTGFQPNSPVQVYLMSDPVLLGTLVTNAEGAFEGAVPVPASTSTGSHTAQINGYVSAQSVRSVSLGVTVVEPRVSRVTRGARVIFGYQSADLSAFAKRKLRTLVDQLPAGGRPESVVVGVVRAQGATVGDRRLARARAARVTAYLRAVGLTGPVAVRIAPTRVENVPSARRVSVRIVYLQAAS